MINLFKRRTPVTDSTAPRFDAPMEFGTDNKVKLPSVPVAAYAIGDHKEMTPGAIRNWRYTEDQEMAMRAVDAGRWVKFVKMHRLFDGQLVADPWVAIAAAYSEVPADGALETGDEEAEPAPELRHGRPWTDEDTRTLCEWFVNFNASRPNLSQKNRDWMQERIASRLKRTRLAIAYKLHSLGLEPRP